MFLRADIAFAQARVTSESIRQAAPELLMRALYLSRPVPQSVSLLF